MAIDGKLEENRLVGTTAGQVAAGSTLASAFYARRKHPVNLANLARLPSLCPSDRSTAKTYVCTNMLEE
jgi:hypothetical protein